VCGWPDSQYEHEEAGREALTNEHVTTADVSNRCLELSSVDDTVTVGVESSNRFSADSTVFSDNNNFLLLVRSSVDTCYVGVTDLEEIQNMEQAVVVVDLEQRVRRHRRDRHSVGRAAITCAHEGKIAHVRE
jgi:hypothetical protein